MTRTLENVNHVEAAKVVKIKHGSSNFLDRPRVAFISSSVGIDTLVNRHWLTPLNVPPCFPLYAYPARSTTHTVSIAWNDEVVISTRDSIVIVDAQDGRLGDMEE
jgi:hypothetical protein